MPIPNPNGGESQEEFVSRCHSAIADDHPDTDERNAICFSTWRNSRNGPDKLAMVAASKFPASKFVKVEDVPVFAEHQAKDSRGNEQVYNRDALAQIVQKLNFRIEDTGDFAPLTDGHTPDDEGGQQPDVLGFVGPFRLGMIGNKKPRYAIFGDEHRRLEDCERLSRMPRRSIEMWMHEEMGERFFDPIAALGAKTPRLDLGFKFARSPGGQLIEKYTAAFPAGGNTFVQDMGEDKEKNHAQEVGTMPSELVREVVQAIDQLDWVQFVKQQMAEQQQTATDQLAPAAPPVGGAPPVPGADGGAPPALAADPVAPAPPAAGPPGIPDKEQPRDQFQADDTDDDGVPDFADVDDDNDRIPDAEDSEDKTPDVNGDVPHEEFDAHGPNHNPEDEEDKEKMSKQTPPAKADKALPDSHDKVLAEKTKYRKMEAERDEYRERFHKLEASVAVIQKEATDAKREATLEKLGLEFAFEVDKQKERCLYSKGSEMNDEAFKSHTESIVELARQIPVGMGLPKGILPEIEKHQKEEEGMSKKAIAYARQRRDAKQPVTYDEAYDHVIKEDREATTTS